MISNFIKKVVGTKRSSLLLFGMASFLLATMLISQFGTPPKEFILLFALLPFAKSS